MKEGELVGVAFRHFKPDPIPFWLTGLVGLKGVQDGCATDARNRSEQDDEQDPHDQAVGFSETVRTGTFLIGRSIFFGTSRTRLDTAMGSYQECRTSDILRMIADGASSSSGQPSDMQPRAVLIVRFLAGRQISSV